MLTARQQQIFDFIVAHRRTHGCSPSIPEIQREFGIRSPNGVACHLAALEEKGCIRRSAQRGSRQIDVPGAAPVAELPVYGAIPAGFPDPTHAGEPAAKWLHIDESSLGFRPDPRTFALRVRGESMRDAGIFDGDTVVVDPLGTPREGSIVAALIDGETTLKRLVRQRGRWFLKAENADYPDLHARESLVVQGVVRTVIRRLA